MALISLVIFMIETISGNIIYGILTCVVIENTTHLINASNCLRIQIYHGCRINLFIGNKAAADILTMLLDASNLSLVVKLAIF